MRRASSVLLAVLGYALMALFSPETATLPAMLAFALGAALLATRPPAPRDEAERVALELLQIR